MEMNFSYFLKCSNCGYSTKIEKTNQNYCINCTKLFPNHFAKWKLVAKNGTLKQYQQEVCEKFTDEGITEILIPRNRRSEIRNPTKEQIKRRAFINDGFPLDRGGYTEWDQNSFIKYKLPILVIIVLVVLVLTLLGKGI